MRVFRCSPQPKLCENVERVHLETMHILKTVSKISRVPLYRFRSNLQGLCKKVLSSELFLKKICSKCIYKKLMKNGVKIFKKVQKPAICRTKQNTSWLNALTFLK